MVSRGFQDGLRRRMDKLKSSIEEANLAVDKEREKNVSLLHMIFPPNIAKRLWLGKYIVFHFTFIPITGRHCLFDLSASGGSYLPLAHSKILQIFMQYNFMTLNLNSFPVLYSWVSRWFFPEKKVCDLKQTQKIPTWIVENHHILLLPYTHLHKYICKIYSIVLLAY